MLSIHLLWKRNGSRNWSLIVTDVNVSLNEIELSGKHVVILFLINRGQISSKFSNMGCALHLTFYMVHISIFFFSFFWLINRAKADTKNCQQTLNLKLKTCFCRSIYDLSVAAPCQYFCDASCTGSSCNSRIGFVVVANFKYVVLASTSLVVAESKSYC